MQADSVLDGLNRYAYVGNNPLKYTDPTGHFRHYAEADAHKNGHDLDIDKEGNLRGTTQRSDRIDGEEGSTDPGDQDYLSAGEISKLDKDHQNDLWNLLTGRDIAKARALGLVDYADKIEARKTQLAKMGFPMSNKYGVLTKRDIAVIRSMRYEAVRGAAAGDKNGAIGLIFAFSFSTLNIPTMAATGLSSVWQLFQNGEINPTNLLIDTAGGAIAGNITSAATSFSTQYLLNEGHSKAASLIWGQVGGRLWTMSLQTTSWYIRSNVKEAVNE